MLSNRMTFSLLSLVMVLGFGLICFVPSATAGFFGASLKAGELMYDVSTTDHKDIEDIQIESGRGRGSAYPTSIAAGPFDDTPATPPGPAIVFSISFDRVVQLTDDVADGVKPSGNALGLDDFAVDAFDDLHRSLGTLSLLGPDGKSEDTATKADDLGILAFATPRLTPVQDPVELPGQQFLLKIKNTALVNAYSAATGGAFEIHYLYLTLKHNAVADASPEAIRKLRTTTADDTPFVADTSPEKPKFIRVDLVEKDEDFAQYANITSTSAATAAASGVPGVVAITRVDPHSGIAATATAPFDVRIVLTEEPKAFTKDHIHVRNGTPGDPVALLPIPADGLSDTDFPRLGYTAKGEATDGLRTNFAPGTDDTAALVPTPFPNPTGRDNKYHLYTVTITPNYDFAGHVDVWVKSFMDKVQPAPNMYHALTEQLLVSDTLSAGAQVARDTRAKNGREVLSVPVKMPKDTTSDAAKLTAEYEKRVNSDDNIEGKQGSFDKAPSLKELPAGLVIPAKGYLVLASGADAATSGIENSPQKVNSKFTDAVRKYNINYGFTLPFPANDLSTFFRNGGTLNLAYADLPLATTAKDDKGNQIVGPSKSKGDDGSKVPDTAHADYTGYDGANSKAYTKGSVIINEIMWGLDAGGTTSQYIELHNTTDTAIGIDKHEWVIAVGSLPTDSTLPAFITIDTVSNADDPATATNEYWKPKGNGGVTTVSVEHPAVMDLVSMSRIPDTVDGTAAASWAASKSPGSVNVIGRRIGTPGAANVYEKPAPPPPPPPPAAKAPVASVGDLMITEIMVDTGSNGNLPQWIEISNVSGAAVRLMGWSINVDNDPSDAVVLPSLNVQLGDIEVGADQSALVISKESNRNSGVGTGDTDAAAGMIRSERIVNAGLDPHAFLSKMSFRIGLVPPAPQTSGAVGRGDVAGNLQQGWELPMAEGNARSSLIRRDMNDKGEVRGTDAAGWVLASTTSHVAIVPYVTYYGDAKDQGSPGIYKAGSALPVELSKFGAKRDPLTGQVVITWETQSELNNAGFFIKRSQQKNSQFVAVNPAMIPGAGTTSEKQSYTYTDTTAQPNIVYYYQIEDVSLDGNRQTLTRAHRLKGHVGAAGKLTTLWGQLKDQE